MGGAYFTCRKFSHANDPIISEKFYLYKWKINEPDGFIQISLLYGGHIGPLIITV